MAEKIQGKKVHLILDFFPFYVSWNPFFFFLLFKIFLQSIATSSCNIWDGVKENSLRLQFIIIVSKNMLMNKQVVRRRNVRTFMNFYEWRSFFFFLYCWFYLPSCTVNSTSLDLRGQIKVCFIHFVIWIYMPLNNWNLQFVVFDSPSFLHFLSPYV